jgi:gluconolactonase
MVTDKDGTVLMAQQGGRTLVRISGKLQLEPFLDNFEGKKFNSPNDLVFASDGSLWFTDPPYGLEGRDQDPRKELPFNGVFRYAHGKLTPMVKDLTLPNGIGFSPDGRTLYVNNSGPEMRVMAYSVAPDGAVSNPRVLLAFPHPEGSGVPDGLKVDSLGNVWTTGPGGVRIVTPQGKVLGQIKLPETAANLAWAADGRTLYITAQTSVYRLHTLVAGEMPLYTR